MEDNNVFEVAVLSSASLNDKNQLEKYSKEIISFINEKNCADKMLTIGNLKNGELIKFLKDNQLNVNVKAQHPVSLRNSNKKIIRESQQVLFLHQNSSKMIKEFIEYANNLDNKNYYVLEV